MSVPGRRHNIGWSKDDVSTVAKVKRWCILETNASDTVGLRTQIYLTPNFMFSVEADL